MNEFLEDFPEVYEPDVIRCYKSAYYYISNNSIQIQRWIGSKFDHMNYALCNCFKTYEEAELALIRHNIICKLRLYALEHNDADIDWSDEDQCKYYIHCGHGHLDINREYISHQMNEIYFTSYEIAKNAIDEIGEDIIKHYVFGANIYYE